MSEPDGQVAHFDFHAGDVPLSVKVTQTRPPRADRAAGEKGHGKKKKKNL